MHFSTLCCRLSLLSFHVLMVFLSSCIPFTVHALSTATTTTTADTTRRQNVLVTGASGRTGQLVFSALLEDPRFEPKALVRSEKSAKKLRKQVPAAQLNQIVICDVTTLYNNIDNEKNDNKSASSSSATTTRRFAGLGQLDSMVICTSAVPVISKWSLFQALVKAPLNILVRNNQKKAIDFRKLRFKWKYPSQYPEIVDYHGQLNQFQLAKELGIQQIVVVGSMGGTDPNNFLNQVGKQSCGNNKEGKGNGDILLWKRKAEKYLVEETDFDYVIIHPGGLVDTPITEKAKKEEYVLDVNDHLFFHNHKKSISRADVANLCVAALALDPNEIVMNNKQQKKTTSCCNVKSSRQETQPQEHQQVTVPSSSSITAPFTAAFLRRTMDESSAAAPKRVRKQLALDCVTQPVQDDPSSSSSSSGSKNAEQALRKFVQKGKIYDYTL